MTILAINELECPGWFCVTEAMPIPSERLLKFYYVGEKAENRVAYLAPGLFYALGTQKVKDHFKCLSPGELPAPIFEITELGQATHALVQTLPNFSAPPFFDEGRRAYQNLPPGTQIFGSRGNQFTAMTQHHVWRSKFVMTADYVTHPYDHQEAWPVIDGVAPVIYQYDIVPIKVITDFGPLTPLQAPSA